MPPSLLQGLTRLPPERPVAMLLRHAARPPIPTGEWGEGLTLTDEGVDLTRQLGQLLGPRLVALHTSPVSRCVQTAQILREGSPRELTVLRDPMLGAPGAFVSDEHLGGQTLQRLGLESFLDYLLEGTGHLPGLAEPETAARALVEHLLALTGLTPGLHVFVTHDSLLAPTLARVLHPPPLRAHWPGFLEAAFFWREGHDLRGAFRDHEAVLGWR